MSRPIVGQIGLGNMGGNVARRLLEEDFDVVGFDVDSEAVGAFEAAGGRRVGSNAELAAEVDVLLSTLSVPAVIEEAYLGPDGSSTGHTTAWSASSKAPFHPARFASSRRTSAPRESTCWTPRSSAAPQRSERNARPPGRGRPGRQ